MFYIGDWKKDAELSMCSLSTRGFWFEILGAMHELGRSGQITGTAQQLARVGRCTAAEAIEAIAELKQTKTANVSERDGIFTLINRRMKAEFDERERNKKYVAKSRKKENVRNCKTNVRRGKDKTNTPDTPENTGLEPIESNLQDDCKENVSPYSSISISKNLQKSGGGGFGATRTHAQGKPPPTAAEFGNLVQNRQWIELTAEEKQMSKADFVRHLEKLHPGKNVREIGRKLKKFCDDHGKSFALERLKGWTAGEAETLTEKDFLDAFGTDEPDWKRQREACQNCDENGYLSTDNGLIVCPHDGEKTNAA